MRSWGVDSDRQLILIRDVSYYCKRRHQGDNKGESFCNGPKLLEAAFKHIHISSKSQDCSSLDLVHLAPQEAALTFQVTAGMLITSAFNEHKVPISIGIARPFP